MENNLSAENIIEEQFNINRIVQGIIKEKILLKLDKGTTHIVDGKIILFSNLIKQLCCNSKKFNYRLNLETVDKELFLTILHFINIIEWKQDGYMIDVKSEELNTWYEKNKKIMSKIEVTAKFLKVRKIIDYLEHRKLNKQNDNLTFKTGVDIKQMGRSSHKSGTEVDSLTNSRESGEATSKNFQEAQPPIYDSNKLSLDLPVDITVIKKNATKNFDQKGKFNPVLKDSNLNNLLDALISDSFWFVVCFFQNANISDNRKKEELKKFINETLKRVTTNYFKFFINLCDDDSTIKKKDPVLNLFRDFMSQCVFYSFYLAFPKSRHIFNEDFKSRIINIFSYLYNGMNAQKNYSVKHWDLDLGKGNILENQILMTQINKNDSKIILPEISDFQKIVKSNLRDQETLSEIKAESESSRNTIRTTILNTPLYRLYAETNRFETLNLIKPIKLSQRKVVDIEQKLKQDSDYLNEVKEYQKLMNKRKKTFNSMISEEDKVVNDKLREIKQNTKRLKREFGNIRVQRYQEYANYCIFISSK